MVCRIPHTALVVLQGRPAADRSDAGDGTGFEVETGSDVICVGSSTDVEGIENGTTSKMDLTQLLFCQWSRRKERKQHLIIDSMEMAIDFRKEPKWIFEAKDVFVDGGRRTPHSNYLNGVQWCPDGGRLLTASADQRWQRGPYVMPHDVTCVF